MKPAMRLANSTTYWMALVMWCAHCCHIHSADCKRETKRNILSALTSLHRYRLLGRAWTSERSQMFTHVPFFNKCASCTLFWKARVSSGVYCTQVNLFMSSALYWHVSKWDLTILWVMRSVKTKAEAWEFFPLTYILSGSCRFGLSRHIRERRGITHNALQHPTLACASDGSGKTERRRLIRSSHPLSAAVRIISTSSTSDIPLLAVFTRRFL